MQPGTLIRRWFTEVWNEGREDIVDELFATGSKAYGLGEANSVTTGPEEFKVFLRSMRDALPDIRIDLLDVICEGDRGAARVLVKGTHLGHGLGVAPTGTRVEVPGIVTVRVANGQAVESWASWDQLGMLQQIGAVSRLDPAPVVSKPKKKAAAKRVAAKSAPKKKAAKKAKRK